MGAKGSLKTHLNKIFEPFFSADQLVTGGGVGLTIAHNIVTKHLNGHISARNHPDGGAEFKITFPIASLPSQTEQDSEHTLKRD